MYLKFFCWVGLGFYALLSVGDWLLTFALLQIDPGAVESNPVAAAFLEQHGWRGLALFKAAVVAVFAAAVVLILRRRPGVAAGLVGLGCAALLWVTTYSHGLLIHAHREAEQRLHGVRPEPQDLTPDDSILPERCWFAAARRTPTRVAALTRRQPTP